ncbi:hypothetical protein [Bacillus sinesaloumensis]|uniref:hypothetical protein n=1 Tax=Litchfieldia sinesaloumensis TaxID=1926280 RepID=UPI0009885D27|nr:hypothetical protein [Bacillus sinesaloumensis]
MKKTIIVLSMLVLVIGFSLLNSNVFADSKKGLSHLVMEHESKINLLEEIIKNIDLDSDVQEVLTPELKQSLIKEVENLLPDHRNFFNLETNENQHINITGYELQENKGKIILKIYTEGEYNWTELDDNSTWEMGPGRKLASGIVSRFNTISKMYGVEMGFEFYQNGERITNFVNLD